MNLAQLIGIILFLLFYFYTQYEMIKMFLSNETESQL